MQRAAEVIDLRVLADALSGLALSTSNAAIDRIRRLQDQFAAHVIPRAKP